MAVHEYKTKGTCASRIVVDVDNGIGPPDKFGGGGVLRAEGQGLVVHGDRTGKGRLRADSGRCGRSSGDQQELLHR